MKSIEQRVQDILIEVQEPEIQIPQRLLRMYRGVFQAARSRARKKQLPYTLTPKDEQKLMIEAGGYCTLT